MCPLLPTKCPLFLIPRSYAPHPVDPCCQTPDGRPLTSSGAVGHLQLVARDIQAEKHRIGHSNPPSDAGPTPFVVSRPAVFEEPVLQSKESCRTTSPQHPTFRAILAGPTPFVVSRPAVFGRSCRTTQPCSNQPSERISACRSPPFEADRQSSDGRVEPHSPQHPTFRANRRPPPRSW